MIEAGWLYTCPQAVNFSEAAEETLTLVVPQRQPSTEHSRKITKQPCSDAEEKPDAVFVFSSACSVQVAIQAPFAWFAISSVNCALC